MRFVSTLTIGVLMFASSGLSHAQPASPASNHGAPPTDDMQALISAFSGHWSLTLKVEPSKEMPGGLEGTGEETWHPGPDGLTLTDEEVFTAGPQKVLIVGFLWRDMKTKDFHAMDCSNQNPDTCDLKGAVSDVVVHWTGSELTIDEKELSSEGKVMTSRAVWSDITPNSFTESGYLGSPGGPFEKVMTIHATRAANK